MCTWLLNSRWPGSAAPRRTELRLQRFDRLPDTVAGAAGLSTQDNEQVVCCVLGLQLRSSHSSSDSAEESSGIAAYVCTRMFRRAAEFCVVTNNSAQALREPTTLRLRSKVFSTGCCCLCGGWLLISWNSSMLGCSDTMDHQQQQLQFSFMSSDSRELPGCTLH